jgi:hypothetical protein
MQRVVWPLKNTMETLTPDGYMIQQRSAICSEPLTEIVIARLRDNNGKSMWVVYTRVLGESTDRDLGVWTYLDGLEFRSMEERAYQSYWDRVKRLSGHVPLHISDEVGRHE